MEQYGSMLGHSFSDTTLNPDSIHRIGCIGTRSRLRPLASWPLVGYECIIHNLRSKISEGVHTYAYPSKDPESRPIGSKTPPIESRIEVEAGRTDMLSSVDRKKLVCSILQFGPMAKP